jgi:hypothetical protein
MVGSALEHAAGLIGQKLDFKDLFITQEQDDEESASLADVLEIWLKKWPKGFTPLSLASMLNRPGEYESANAQMVRDFLLNGKERFISEKSVGWLLKQHIDAAVFNGLVLRKDQDSDTRTVIYRVERLKKGGK